MIKGKKYPYMAKKKQQNVYLSLDMWTDIESLLDTYRGESRNSFIKTALINEIIKRRRENKEKLEAKGK